MDLGLLLQNSQISTLVPSSQRMAEERERERTSRYDKKCKTKRFEFVLLQQEDMKKSVRF